MTNKQTIQDILDIINPMPAMLSAKGKKQPEVSFLIEANARIAISMNWVKFEAKQGWERDYEAFIGSFEEAVQRATDFINQLPDAETERLHSFMGQLGKLIDVGNAHGIKVEYLNPLTETMKRLSENALTYRGSSSSPRVTAEI